MKARPMLFNGEMVRALLCGRKTQTRRIIKPQIEPWGKNGYKWDGHKPNSKYGAWAYSDPNDIQFCMQGNSLHGQVGDLIWVKETWKPTINDDVCGVTYRADDKFIEIEDTEEASERWVSVRRPEEQHPSNVEPKWRPSLFMFRWASRLTLRITDVRVEQVQDITEKDAIAEGLRIFNKDDANLYYSSAAHEADWELSPVDAYKKLWNSINKNWGDNPWVWCISFDVINKNINSVGGAI